MYSDEAAFPWIDQARYDLDTARSMLEAGRYVYVVFCCQQAVEKWLKGRIAGVTNELPPRTHNLVALVEQVIVDVDESRLTFLRELSAYYIQSRYPADLDLSVEVDSELAKKILRTTEECLAWLSSTP